MHTKTYYRILSLLIVIQIAYLNDKITNNGIEFVYQQKLLLAEMFINVEFIIPFPSLPNSLDIQLANFSSMLEQSWNAYKYGSNLTYMNTNESSLNFDYLSGFVDKQLQLARQDLQDLRTDISETLMRNDSHERNRRGVPLIAFGALTAVTAGAGIACSIGSIFGACGGSTKNRDDIDFALQKLEENGNLWIEVQSKLNDKFYIVASQLKDVKQTQKQIVQTQKQQASTLNKAIDVINSNSRKLMACTQYFYARDQKLKLQTNLASSLLALNNEIKRYRIATYSYKLTILNSIMTMVNKFIHMALVPKQILDKILQSLATQQTKEDDRLTLAIPPSQILTYYETKLLTNVVVEDYGMLFRLAVPFASGSTALNLYRAITIPMPTNDTDGYASQYKTEADYIAIAESTRRIALLSQPEIDSCIGSSSFSVCTNGFSLETAEDTCLGALLIGNQFAALQNCNINTVKLPVKEKAKNLGNGKWLITSASEKFDMFLSEMKNNDPLKRQRLPGCKTCVIELQCGTKIETRFMELRADMFSCRNDSAVRIDGNLTDPLQHLFSKILSLNKMPHISTLTQAREQVIEKVQLELANVPDYHRKSFDRLDELT